MTLTDKDLQKINKLIKSNNTSLATKDDLKAFATKDDLKQFEDRLQAEMVENNEVMMDYVKTTTNEALERIEKKIDHLPTKDIYYKNEAQTNKRVENVEIEVDLTTARSVENKDNIEKLNKTVFGN